MPAWLSASSASDQPGKEEQPAQEDLPLGDIPNWLKAAAPQSSIYSDLPADPTPPTSDEDWLNSFKSSNPAEDQSPPQLTPAFSTEESQQAPPRSPRWANASRTSSSSAARNWRRPPPWSASNRTCWPYCRSERRGPARYFPATSAATCPVRTHSSIAELGHRSVTGGVHSDHHGPLFGPSAARCLY